MYISTLNKCAAGLPKCETIAPKSHLVRRSLRNLYEIQNCQFLKFNEIEITLLTNIWRDRASPLDRFRCPLYVISSGQSAKHFDVNNTSLSMDIYIYHG